MKFASRLSNIVGVEARKRVGSIVSIVAVAFRFGDKDIDEAGSIASARLNELCHQKSGYSNEAVEVAMCQRTMSGLFLVAESVFGFHLDNLEVILRKRG